MQQGHPCSICKSDRIRQEYRSSRLHVTLCDDCGHREAFHTAAAPGLAETDYYENTPQDDSYVGSLRLTRERQALDVLARMKARMTTEKAWLDFGAGRGWFLDTARRAGWTNVTGFDASPISSNWLRDRGVPMAAPSKGDALWPDWASLPRAPSIVSFFDVLEHFPMTQAAQALARLKAEVPALSHLIIKVPVSEGVLFRLARAMRGWAPGPYEQLFQVGTFPPHYHYFSRRSLARFVADAQLEPELVWDDPDVDDLFDRIPKLAGWPGGRIAARTISMLGGDTRIALVRA